MLITPNGKTVYAADGLVGRVTPIDTATGTAGKPIYTHASPYAVTMSITPDGRTLYVIRSGAPGPGSRKT